MEPEHKMVCLLIVCAALVVGSGLFYLHYNSSILPQRMAEKGYCYALTVGATTSGGVNTFWTYIPCQQYKPAEASK